MHPTNIARLACAALAVTTAGAAFAQAGYPSKPVRMVVPSSAGGGTDIVARIMAPELSKRLGQQVVIDNRPGAGTMIGLEVAGRVVLGVCDDPPIDRRYWAVAGGGAFRSDAGAAGVRIRVSDTRELAAARSFIPPAEWVRGDEAKAMATAFARATKPAPAEDHPALQVAFGGYDVAVFFMAGPWDLAAPSIVVEEAGGRFTDIAGGSTLLHGAVFSNGTVHDATVDCLRTAREG